MNDSVREGVRFMRQKLDDDEWPGYLHGLATRFQEILNLAAGKDGPRFEVRVRETPDGQWEPVGAAREAEGDRSAR